jgi:hypothetical protein
MSFLLLLMSSLQQIGEKGRTVSAWKQSGVGEKGRGGWQGGEMTQTVYAYVNK